MQSQHIITNNNTLLQVDGGGTPHLHITQQTLEGLYELERTYPDIPLYTINHEVNATLVELWSRIRREYEGNA